MTISDCTCSSRLSRPALVRHVNAATAAPTSEKLPASGQRPPSPAPAPRDIAPTTAARSAVWRGGIRLVNTAALPVQRVEQPTSASVSSGHLTCRGLVQAGGGPRRQQTKSPDLAPVSPALQLGTASLGQNGVAAGRRPLKTVRLRWTRCRFWAAAI